MTDYWGFTAANTSKVEEQNTLQRLNLRQLMPDVHFLAGMSLTPRQLLKFQ
jgi:hypothetical protein